MGHGRVLRASKIVGGVNCEGEMWVRGFVSLMELVSAKVRRIGLQHPVRSQGTVERPREWGRETSLSGLP